MATSEDVLRAARRIETRSRTRSGSFLRSRLVAPPLCGLSGASRFPGQLEDQTSIEDSDEDNEYEDEDADAANDGAFWMRTTRRQVFRSQEESLLQKSKIPHWKCHQLSKLQEVLPPQPLL